MKLAPDQLDGVKGYMIDHRDQFRALWRSDADLVNLFRSGEVVLADGGPGLTERIRDTGVDARWVAPVERPLSWVCGLSITSDSANIPGAYRLINWQASPRAQAIRADDGYVVTNPEAIKLAAPSSRRDGRPEDHRERDPGDRAARLRAVGSGLQGVSGRLGRRREDDRDANRAYGEPGGRRADSGGMRGGQQRFLGGAAAEGPGRPGDRDVAHLHVRRHRRRRDARPVPRGRTPTST